MKQNTAKQNTMTEEQLLANLEQYFPDKIIYDELYGSRRFLPYRRQIQKIKGDLSSPLEWLYSKGFVRREVGYCEPELKTGTDVPEPDRGSAWSLADYAFRKYPLAGQMILTPAEHRLVISEGRRVMKRFLEPGGFASGRDQTVLTFAIIQACKGWESTSEDVLWNYIYLQFGFPAERIPDLKDKLYTGCCGCILTTLPKYNRFLAPSKGYQRYYTSLLLHALAPRSSIFEFLDILFAFYINDLDFQYEEDDIGYRQFVTAMRTRWSYGQGASSVKLKSGYVNSGLKALMETCRGFSATLCDSLAFRMDALLRGEEDGLLDPEHDEWDRLLLEWYRRKTSTVRTDYQRRRQEHRTEYVATSKSRIYVRYALQNEIMGLEIPMIRLEGTGSRPVLTISQGERRLYQREMSVLGDDMCWTTRSLFLPLKDFNVSFSQSLNLSVRIEHRGDTLYDSKSGLFREFLLFDSMGRERGGAQIGRGMCWLYVPAGREVTFSDESSVWQLNHPGQLFHVDLNNISSIAADGDEIFADPQISSGFRHYTSVQPVPGISAEYLGTQARVYPRPFTLTLCLPEGENRRRYQADVDGVRGPLDPYLSGDGSRLQFPSAGADGRIHRIRLIDLTDNRVRYSISFLVLEQCRVRVQPPVLLDGLDAASVTLSCRGREFVQTVPPGGGDTAVFPDVLDGRHPLETVLPLVRCSLWGCNAFSFSARLWKGDVPSDGLLELHLPDGWTGTLTLGGEEIPPAPDGIRYELANVIRSRPESAAPESLELILQPQNGTGEVRKHRITRIIYAPQFAEAPLETDDGKLLWNAGENFIGDRDSRFEIEVRPGRGEPRTFQAGTESGVLAEIGDWPHGRCPYRILLKKKGLFARGKTTVLHEGVLHIGTAEESRYEGVSLQLQTAIYWDLDQEQLNQSELRSGTCFLHDLHYLGESIPDGEALPMPCYTGTLSGYVGDQVVPYPSGESEGDEEVNPVSVWVVNDQLLVLLCASEDAPYVDLLHHEILREDPDCSLTRAEQRRYVRLPDYLEYTESEA